MKVEEVVQALKLEVGQRYLLIYDRQAVSEKLIRTVAQMLWDRDKVKTLWLGVHGKPADAVRILEVKP